MQNKNYLNELMDKKIEKQPISTLIIPTIALPSVLGFMSDIIWSLSLSGKFSPTTKYGLLVGVTIGLLLLIFQYIMSRTSELQKMAAITSGMVIFGIFGISTVIALIFGIVRLFF